METQFMSNQNMTGDVGESKEKGFFEKAKEFEFRQKVVRLSP